MAKAKFDMSPVEPAHPMAVKSHEDLVALYTRIREKYQTAIDQAFDKVSREVGFVVATALPFTYKAGDDRAKGIIITEGLKGTLFDKELGKVLKGFRGSAVPKVAAGTYKLYLFWFDALKLKLQTDWMEPAHAICEVLYQECMRKTAPGPGKDWLEPAHSVPEVREPAHWFDPGTAIGAEEAVLISAIDKVYPELRLADRIASYRDASRRRTISGVREPAHFRAVEHRENVVDVLSEIAALLRRHGY